MLLLAHLSFVANSPLNAVFTFTLSCLSTVFRTRSSITLPASSKNRSGSMWLEFITDPVNIWLSNALLISRHRSLYPAPTCTSRPCIESFKLSSLAIYVITDCLLPIDNRECLAWLFQIFHRSHATYSSMIFNWVACSIKSPSMLSLALINDAMSKSSNFIYLLLGHMTFVSHWWCHRSNMLWHVIPCRMFEKSNHVTVTSILFSNVAFINQIALITSPRNMLWHVAT